MGNIEQYFIDHITACLESTGEDTTVLRKRIKILARNRIDKTVKILKDGLDVGTVAEHRITVALVNDPNYGWCFDGGKGYDLHPILDHT